MKQILFGFFFLWFGSTLYAQGVKADTSGNDVKISALPYYSYGKGIGITSPDSLFQFNIRFRMQNRASYLKEDGAPGAYSAEIRRLRLRFDGFVVNPKFLYAIQLSFAPGDVGALKEGENLNIIRDAVFIYRPNSRWNFSFGQTKLPGNRQRVNSSGGLQLTDRSLNNAKFTLDRDFGFQVHNFHEFKDRFSYNLKAALTTGEGRNSTEKPDDGIAVTAKVEILPLGIFSKDGTYFEGDIIREPRPKLMFSAAVQQNNHARRTQGQLGEDLFETRTMKSLLLDAMFKYNGWAAMASYMSRVTSDSPITVNAANPTQIRYVFTGHGFDYQLSYNTRKNYELIGRYSIQNTAQAIRSLTPNTREYTLGLTRYLWEHTFKLQTEFSYGVLQFANGTEKNNWYVRFQIEMGI